MYPFGYNSKMFQVKQTSIFNKWLSGLKDKQAKARILVRLESCRLGNLGDAKSVGNRISELRIHFGKGYRIYFTKQKGIIILLLCGGTKSSQKRDILKAKQILNDVVNGKER